MIIIRSQDRLELVKTEWVSVDREYVYVRFRDKEKFQEIGIYKSEERALEVLNEIQDAIIAGTKLDVINRDRVKYYKEKVFEMPVE
ncbi:MULTISPECIES: hypothetical protein [Clostridioides]|uniref:hypothetical protein n=1 Tax=Clostridioides sp. ZZV14-6387 TaxID=2811497 RepID=UPI0007BB916C|nr:hypothetical protein [Clostridioides sp. ZZV14-6387]CZR95404.1 hypothetical protein CDFC105_60192 [Clostridioides difficile]CZS11230.1 hypothetical protein CDFC105_73906 [Clostridioides difficile]